MTLDDDWQVERLSLLNYRCFPEISLNFATPVTALVGINGSGKTAVLDALAVSIAPAVKVLGGKAHGFAQRDARVRATDLDSRDSVASLDAIYPVSAEATAVMWGHRFESKRERGSAKSGTTGGSREMREFARHNADQARDETAFGTILPVVAYYAADRFVGDRRVDGYSKSSRFGPYETALSSRLETNTLSAFLEVLSAQITNAVAFGDNPPNAARAQFEAIDGACTSVLKSTGWGRPRWNPIARELTLTRHDGETLPLSWLSSGTKVVAALVIDIASRMARANPHLGGQELVASTPGIVIIDEVDLHLHPKWQQQIVPSLVKTFPRVQFIVSTHSPQVLSTIDARGVRVLEGSDARTPEHSAGLRSDVILRNIQRTRPEPDVEERRLLEEYLRLVYDGRGTSRRAVELRRRVENELGGIENNAELADADAYMSLSDLGL